MLVTSGRLQVVPPGAARRPRAVLRAAELLEAFEAEPVVVGQQSLAAVAVHVGVQGLEVVGERDLQPRLQPPAVVFGQRRGRVGVLAPQRAVASAQVRAEQGDGLLRIARRGGHRRARLVGAGVGREDAGAQHVQEAAVVLAHQRLADHRLEPAPGLDGQLDRQMVAAGSVVGVHGGQLRMQVDVAAVSRRVEPEAVVPGSAVAGGVSPHLGAPPTRRCRIGDLLSHGTENIVNHSAHLIIGQ